VIVKVVDLNAKADMRKEYFYSPEFVPDFKIYPFQSQKNLGI
jgi:hypothetical protein